MLPVSLIFTSGVASGVNCYAAVLVLGLLGRFGHIAGIPAALERPPVLAAAAVLYIGQFVAGKIPVLDSAWDVAHTALRPVVGGAIGVAMAQQAHASPAAAIAAAALGGGSALASHVVKTGMRVGVNASPEPFSNIAASLLEDLGMAGLVSFAVFHPVPAAILTAVVLAASIAMFALLASRIRRAWQRRRDARLGRRAAGGPKGRTPWPQGSAAIGRIRSATVTTRSAWTSQHARSVPRFSRPTRINRRWDRRAVRRNRGTHRGRWS